MAVVVRSQTSPSCMNSNPSSRESSAQSRAEIDVLVGPRTAIVIGPMVVVVVVVVALWRLFPRVRGFWENVRQFIPRLRFFFFF